MDERGTSRVEVADGFYLSRIRHGDQAAYLEHFTDPEIARHTLVIPFPYTAADADWWVEHCRRQFREPEMRFAVRRSDGYLVGAIGTVGDVPAAIHEVEIGYWLAAAYRDHGLMVRVIHAYAEHLFRRSAVRRLHAKPFAFNLASARVLQKADFRHGGLLREHFCKDGQRVDALLYHLGPEDISPL